MPNSNTAARHKERAEHARRLALLTTDARASAVLKQIAEEHEAKAKDADYDTPERDPLLMV